MTWVNDFLSMGGYAAYIWPSYLLAALVLIGFLVSSLRSLKSQERRLAQLEAAAPPRARRRQGAKASAKAGGSATEKEPTEP